LGSPDRFSITSAHKRQEVSRSGDGKRSGKPQGNHSDQKNGVFRGKGARPAPLLVAPREDTRERYLTSVGKRRGRQAGTIPPEQGCTAGTRNSVSKKKGKTHDEKRREFDSW